MLNVAFSCFIAMLPRIDTAAKKVMADAAAARVAERKKMRPTVEVPGELKRIQKGP